MSRRGGEGRLGLGALPAQLLPGAQPVPAQEPLRLPGSEGGQMAETVPTMRHVDCVALD